MKTIALALVLAIGAPAFATNEENPCGNHGNNCCTDDGGQSYDSTESTCQQVVNASPESYCASYAAAVAAASAEARALAICGDATANCQGGAAFSLAVTKQACVQTSIQISELSQVSVQTQEAVNSANASCSSAEQTCGDTALTCNVSCPVCPTPPDVEVGTRVLRCKKWKQRANGTYVGKHCLTVTEAYPQ